MKKQNLRTPKFYDGTEPTSKDFRPILHHFLLKMDEKRQNNPLEILSAWPELIGEAFSKMTKAESFMEGVLHVKVSNSTLYSLLVQHEGKKLLKSLKSKFPSVKISSIRFRIG